MNRSTYYDCIAERLNTLSLNIISRSKSNILNYNVHAENFYRDLFNLLFNWELININVIQHNAEAIDLVDSVNSIIIQVSATNTKEKIESSLSKIPKGKYNNFRFKFISIAKCAKNLKEKTYKLPQGISFEPKSDIYDIEGILQKIIYLDINKQKTICDFICAELSPKPKQVPIPIRLNSNLTQIIKSLSKEDLSSPVIPSFNVFEIERKIDFNKLSTSRVLINDRKIYQDILEKIYSTFDAMGESNKRTLVLERIKKIYLESEDEKKGDELFILIVRKIKQLVMESGNIGDMTEEEIDLGVDILVVDAFIRCKIFKNPENYNYNATI